jgi:hypothetical protein
MGADNNLLTDQSRQDNLQDLADVMCPHLHVHDIRVPARNSSERSSQTIEKPHPPNRWMPITVDAMEGFEIFVGAIRRMVDVTIVRIYRHLCPSMR